MNTSTHGEQSARVLAEAVADLLGPRRLAVAESCTGGRIATALSSVEFATDFFCGGVTPYTEEAKRRLLGITAGSVYTAEAAEEMAVAVRALLRADVGLATSGVAGTEPVDGVPPGTVFFGFSVGDRRWAAVERFHGDPPDICDTATVAALRGLARGLEAGGSDGAG